MKPLQKEFDGIGEVKGFRFKQLKSNGKAYIYEVYQDSSNSPTHYEVFEHRENNQYNVVSYPRSAAFGVYAYTEKTIQDAERKYEELTDRVNKRKKDETERI